MCFEFEETKAYFTFLTTTGAMNASMELFGLSASNTVKSHCSRALKLLVDFGMLRRLLSITFSGVAPGIFRRRLTLPTRGLNYGFQGTINAKNLRKIAFHLPTGG